MQSSWRSRCDERIDGSIYIWHATRKQISPKSWQRGVLARIVLGARGILPAFILNWLESTMVLNSLRLLIVDDEEAARYGMRRALETFRCEIVEAESAEAARALMRSSKFDLVLLDVNLPGITGLEFLQELQAESAATKVESPHVIIITAHGSERVAVQAVKAGAYDYLSKPFEVDDLRLVVKNAFENIKLRRENRSLRRQIEIERSQRGALLGN